MDTDPMDTGKRGRDRGQSAGLRHHVTYDLDGNVTSVINPTTKITYSYDADNEETGETWVTPAAAARSTL